MRAEEILEFSVTVLGVVLCHFKESMGIQSLKRDLKGPLMSRHAQRS